MSSSCSFVADFFSTALLVSAVSCSYADRIVGGYECVPHTHDLSINEGSRQSPRVVKTIQHPGFDYRTTDNDNMLIKVSPPVQFNEEVQPIRLPSSCASDGTQRIASGWGSMMNGEEQFPDRLQCLEVPILSDTECGSSYKDSITPNMFCAGFLEGGKETCQADSGGPLVCAGEQQGLVSWGFECGHPGYPGVYTKLCNYIRDKNKNIDMHRRVQNPDSSSLVSELEFLELRTLTMHRRVQNLDSSSLVSELEFLELRTLTMHHRVQSLDSSSLVSELEFLELRTLTVDVSHRDPPSLVGCTFLPLHIPAKHLGMGGTFYFVQGAIGMQDFVITGVCGGRV
ncbi:trypsin-3-like [Carcharodon carcharias]|uniref:trypsin-3-like n=1 Tax=Carcharodon carcharias TaxID=13397 RepID=UPI001B7DAD70|nr:trypsin-3-like [Carcharodon carcharias]